LILLSGVLLAADIEECFDSGAADLMSGEPFSHSCFATLTIQNAAMTSSE
jgi:hypothetical protein